MTTAVLAESIPDDVARSVMLPKSYGDLEGTVFPACAWLRENAPVGRAELAEYDPVWLVSTHELVKVVLGDAELFHNADANVMLQPQAGDEYLRSVLGGTTKVQTNLSYMDPPDHTIYRNATSFAFLPAQIQGLEPGFKELARQAVDRLLDESDGECDFVEALSTRFPLHAVLKMLGVPEQDYDLMLKLTQDTFGGDDPDWRRDDIPATPEAMARQWLESAQDFYRYFLQIKNDRLANPRDDLSTSIVTAKLTDGSYMPEIVQVNLVMSIALAGHDTTNSAISAGMHGLATTPDQLELVQRNPKLIGGLTDEALRWATPVKHFMRNATADATVGGIDIAAGDRLMALFVSANRDESVFANPDQFDVTRRPNPHLSFSYGPHVCLGQHIAKMEMRALFAELVPRLKSVELAAEPTLKVSNFVSGFKKLPIRFVRA